MMECWYKRIIHAYTILSCACMHACLYWRASVIAVARANFKTTAKLNHRATDLTYRSKNGPSTPSWQMPPAPTIPRRRTQILAMNTVL